MTDPTGWRVSSYSGGNNNCVEVAMRDGAVLVRDTKAREAGRIQATPVAWDALVALLIR